MNGLSDTSYSGFYMVTVAPMTLIDELRRIELDERPRLYSSKLIFICFIFAQKSFHLPLLLAAFLQFGL